MDDKQDQKKRQELLSKFLSEIESYSSELRGNKFKNMPSVKIMKKLRQLWKRKRFLTDDEGQSKYPMNQRYLEDSSMDYQVEQKPRQPQFSEDEARRNVRRQPGTKKESSASKPLHPRDDSSSEERTNHPTKMKKKRGSESRGGKNKSIQQYSIRGQLSQIEAFNSAIEDFSS